MLIYMTANGFTWKESAKRTNSIYHNVPFTNRLKLARFRLVQGDQGRTNDMTNEWNRQWKTGDWPCVARKMSPATPALRSKIRHDELSCTLAERSARLMDRLGMELRLCLWAKSIKPQIKLCHRYRLTEGICINRLNHGRKAANTKPSFSYFLTTAVHYCYCGYWWAFDLSRLIAPGIRFSKSSCNHLSKFVRTNFDKYKCSCTHF